MTRIERVSHIRTYEVVLPTIQCCVFAALQIASLSINSFTGKASGSTHTECSDHAVLMPALHFSQGAESEKANLPENRMLWPLWQRGVSVGKAKTFGVLMDLRMLMGLDFRMPFCD